ncbi:hypothetical protein I316_01049 [Kwoniella heveanensis BCC8398]|uniref:UDP-glycosyltransferases domain-containing protein n=1 Tax=Kwoniella heveanensis BCC8398 TaxID=1296120 RepID=A0A1B9H1J4_9TREE|nr:hypothetical protein I316_01049 [Kwoniella heveanensis BCC8398]
MSAVPALGDVTDNTREDSGSFQSRPTAPPSIQLSLNLLSTRPALVITILITRNIRLVVEHELDLHPSWTSGRYNRRLRVDCVGQETDEPGQPFVECQILRDAVENTDVLDKYLSDHGGGDGDGVGDMDETEGKPTLLRQSHRATSVEEDETRVPEPWGSVGLIICDMFNPFIRPAVKARGSKVPVFVFFPTMALAMLRYILPTSEGGVGEHMMERYEALKAQGGQGDAEEGDVCRRAFRYVENKLLCWPNLPPMYDHEWTPQSEARESNVSFLRTTSTLHSTVRDCDGLITAGFEEAEQESMELVQAALGVPVLGVGPQFSEDTWQAAEEESNEAETHEAMSFLDHCLRTYGSESTAYISFGTVFWPTLRPSLIENIVTSLLTLEPPMPFIWATASTNGKISENLRDKIQDSGRGEVFDWVPQMKVLKHPAVGIFMTHTGYGSLTETIVAGVPILTLPFVGDQSPLSAHFTKIRPIGIQLDQLITASSYPITLGDGTIVDGSEAAILAELKNSWERARITISENEKSSDSSLAEASTIISGSRHDTGPPRRDAYW